ncbi:major facilitator transporter [Cohnella kolymensis]|uniref:Major facilitator transporter n=1 Tax=Cohnella kolymensis TaxID=1590652 RepID=A0ABR5A9I3_9BACL|nr:MFS transporter [Cohnella kolymensis]KIL37567.1 major facilitator transporter [Cohnella kolymensis]
MTRFIQEWKHQLSGYSRNIRLFLWFNFLWNTGLGIFTLDYNLYIKALGYSQTMVGDIVAMTTLAAAIILVPAGLMNDKFGSKRIVSIGIFLVVAALIARSVITAEHGLLVSAFMTGLSFAFVSVPLLPFMTENSSPDQRVHLFSFNLALVMGASVIGSVLGGLLSDMFHLWGGLSEVLSLRITLLLGIGIAALGSVPVLLFESAGKEKETSRTEFAWRTVWKNHKSSMQVIFLFAVLGLMSSIAGGMLVPYLNVYFADRFHSSTTAIGIIVSLGQGATAIAYLIGPLIVRRLGETKSLMVLQLSSIPFMLITAYSMNFYLASAGYLFRQALMNAATPFWNSIKMNLVHRSLRGLASSTGEAVFNLGWFLAAPVSTGLVARYGSYYGYAYAFTVTAVVYTLIAVMFYFFFSKDRFKPPEDSLPATK